MIWYSDHLVIGHPGSIPQKKFMTYAVCSMSILRTPFIFFFSTIFLKIFSWHLRFAPNLFTLIWHQAHLHLIAFFAQCRLEKCNNLSQSVYLQKSVSWSKVEDKKSMAGSKWSSWAQLGCKLLYEINPWLAKLSGYQNF
jgi:hypothetical protein